MDDIVSYLQDDTLLTDKEAQRLRNKAALFWLNLEGKLYHRSFTRSYLPVAPLNQVPGILEELIAAATRAHSL